MILFCRGTSCVFLNGTGTRDPCNKSNWLYFGEKGVFYECPNLDRSPLQIKIFS